MTSVRKRQLWKICNESNIWNNYPTKPKPDKLSRLFIIEPEDITKHEFTCSSFNKNGNKLATIDQRGNIYEFDFKIFKYQLVSRCGSCGNSITYSPKYDDITVALNNKDINIFECGQYKLSSKIKTSHKNNINQLQYSFINNKLVLLSSSSDIIILWDINNNYQQLQSLSHHYSIIFGLISPSLESIVTCFGNDMISFWDWTNYKEKYEIFYSDKQLLKKKIGHKHLQLICGDIDNKNGLLIVGGRGNYIYLWLINKKMLLKCIVLPITIKHVIQLKFLQNHSSNIILLLGDDGQIVGINHKTLNITFYIQRNDQFIKSFSISNNNQKISCTLSDGTIEIMSIKSLCKQYKICCNKCTDSDINSVMEQPSQLSCLTISTVSSELQKHIQKDTINKLKSLKNNILCVLSVDKLNNYLLTNNCYADKYRLMIWNFLLNIPNLENVYKHYQQKGINNKWKLKLNDNIIIKDTRIKHRLLTVLSLLSNWCKLCEQIDFLPSFILPFIKLYKQNDIECFESIVFILCKYCSEWFIDYPDSSIKILSFWISSIKHFDIMLYNHFKHHFIDIEHNLWHIISNAFDTFFSKTDWKLLWDHIITNPPLFLHVIPISIVLCCKNVLYAMHSKNDIDAFFSHQQQIYIKNIIDKAYDIVEKLPKLLIPSFEPITISIENNNDNIKQYPIFNRYPTQSLELIQHNNISKLQIEANNEKHEQLLKALQLEHQEITAKQAKFSQEQQMLDYLYKQRISKLQFDEEQYALAQKQKSNEITQKRLNAIGNIQKSIQEMLNEKSKIKQLAINDVDNKLLHHKKISEIQHDSCKNSAALNQLESDTRNRLNGIYLQQCVDAQQLKLQRLQQQFDNERKLKQQLLEQTLESKDNLSKFKFIQQKNLFSTMNQLENEYETEQLIKNKLKLQSIMNDNRTKEIEQENELTDLMNEQLNINQNMIEKQNKLQNICQKQEDFEIDLMTDQYNEFKQNIKTKQENILKNHKNELLNKLKEQQKKLNKLSKTQRLKHFETLLKQEENSIKSDLLSKDKQLEETIYLIQNQIESLNEKEMELNLKKKQILEKNAFERIAKDAETQIINEEKEKYANIRLGMLEEMQRKEEKLREKHEEIMNSLMKKRENELLLIGQNAKDKIHEEEMNVLEKEYDIKKNELKELKESFNVKQNEIKKQLMEQSNAMQRVLHEQ